mmetsp:Transcript_97635/g.173911  ORF Transcript_97635/g.173911 Transcript_97635/m.173911 type:complete len:538 (+) Transcript_97635:183-1796(+)
MRGSIFRICLLHFVEALLREKAPPDDWSLCDSLSRFAEHEPILFGDAIPEDLRQLLSRDSLMETGATTWNVQATDNGYYGLFNAGHQAALEMTVAETLGLFSREKGSLPKHGRLNLYVPQQALPSRLQAQVYKSVPAWLPFCPDRTRLWLSCGGPPLISPLHRDNYYNVYFMLNGTKDFQLIPPWQTHIIDPLYTRLDPQINPTADSDPVWAIGRHWSRLGGKNRSKAVSSWHHFGADARRADVNLSRASRIKVTLQPGDILVIPPFWWHSALQEGEAPTLALNMWFKLKNPLDNVFFILGTRMHRKWRDTNKTEAAAKKFERYQKEQKSKAGAAMASIKALMAKHAPGVPVRFAPKPVNENVGEYLGHDQLHDVGRNNTCIHWKFDNFSGLQGALRAEDALKGIDLSIVERILSGALGTWDAVQKSYASYLGGTSGQLLNSWRHRMWKKWHEPLGSAELPIGFWSNVSHLVPQGAGAPFFSMLPGCSGTCASHGLSACAREGQGFEEEEYCQAAFHTLVRTVSRRIASCALGPCDA